MSFPELESLLTNYINGTYFHDDKKLSDAFKSINKQIRSSSVEANIILKKLLPLVSSVLNVRGANFDPLCNHFSSLFSDLIKRGVIKNMDQTLKSEPSKSVFEDAKSYLSHAILSPNWTYFVLVDQGFLKQLMGSISSSKTAGTDNQVGMLAVIYANLIRLYSDCPNCYLNVVTAFGDTTIELYIKYWTLITLPDDLIPTFVHDITLPQTSSINVLAEFNNLPDWIIKSTPNTALARKLFSNRNTWDVVPVAATTKSKQSPSSKEVAALLQSRRLIRSIESCLTTCFERQGVHTRNRVIKWMGPAFQRYFELNADSMVDNGPTLVLLDGITHCFKSYPPQEDVKEILRPLVDKLDNDQLNDYLYIDTGKPKDTLPIINGLIGMYDLTKLPRFFDSAMNMLVTQHDSDSIDQLTERIVHDYPSLTKEFVDSSIDMISRVALNNHFYIVCHKLEILDQSMIKKILLGLKIRQHSVLKFIHAVNTPNAWIMYVDLVGKDLRQHSQKKQYPHQRYAQYIDDLIFTKKVLAVLDKEQSHPAAVYRLLMHVYSVQDSLTPDQHVELAYHSTKQQLLATLSPDHLDTTHYRQQFKQFKSQSNDHTIIAPGHTHDQHIDISILPTLVIRRIIEIVLLDNVSNMVVMGRLFTRWIVSLATVSKHFHKEVTLVVSNSIMTNLDIRSKLKYIGHQSCLFQTPPLHLGAKDIKHIPTKHLEQCMERLQSLIVPFSNHVYEHDMGEDLYILIHVHAPNVQHIKFVEQPNFDQFHLDLIGPTTKESRNKYIRIDYPNKFVDDMDLYHTNFLPVLIDHYMGMIQNSRSSLQSITFDMGTMINPCQFMPQDLIGKVSCYLTLNSEYNFPNQGQDYLAQHITKAKFSTDMTLYHIIPKLINIRELIIVPGNKVQGHAKFKDQLQQLLQTSKQLNTLMIIHPDMSDIISLLPGHGDDESHSVKNIHTLRICFTDVEWFIKSHTNGTIDKPQLIGNHHIKSFVNTIRLSTLTRHLNLIYPPDRLYYHRPVDQSSYDYLTGNDCYSIDNIPEYIMVSLTFAGKTIVEFSEMLTSVKGVIVGLNIDSPLDKPLTPGLIPKTVKTLDIGSRYIHLLEPGVIPASVTQLNLDYRQKLEPGFIPASVTNLKLQSYSEDLDVDVLPASITKLFLGNSYNKPLPPGVLPANLVKLHLGLCYRVPMENISLPKSCRKVRLGYANNLKPFAIPPHVTQLAAHFPPLVEDIIPPSVTKLSIESNSSLEAGSIPVSVEYLRFGTAFHEEIAPGTIPNSVTNINLGVTFNNAINNLPDSILYLRMSSNFNQPLSPGDLPARLETLIFGSEFDQELVAGVLPSTLQVLEFGIKFNQVLTAGVIPNGVRQLVFGARYNQLLEPGFLPNSITYLALGDDYNQQLNPGVVPDSVTHLSLGLAYDHGQQLVAGSIPESVINIRVKCFSSHYLLSSPNRVIHVQLTRDSFTPMEIRMIDDNTLLALNRKLQGGFVPITRIEMIRDYILSYKTKW
ncbi:hypothetical protein SAMD00019534_079390 [Acytostelium subglobosum LB1]|uniref:hypothetical protein n=1 Tax=Acytostelium subglobosum LB1 TaxID=1410327 RepID=UPI000644B4A1|nr:hypothetical protein SAMD00019534_079390 [Acytostelium subglobosum LB1]GAM24764.1 hypothetical protein SAMD00019534_079390 [Acytostelium subglobosum LB1]|eukprot:XP_012752433.1 hypothetical protein SAMD00019534_079390 [Acytostelium subglobosum LB1]